MAHSTDKSFFLTGCASGVGAHLTTELVKTGAKIYATDINWEGLQKQQEQNRWPSTQVTLGKLDVTSLDDWQSNYQKALQALGSIDVHMNVAGYLLPGDLMLADPVQIHRHFDINVKGLIFGSQFAARQMMKQMSRGHIVNICSLGGIAAVPGIGLYCSSKFAVRGFTLSLAEELRPKGIAVTVVCPDAIKTPMLDLQRDYKEAAYTFSGGGYLTVEDISHAMFKSILPKRPLEYNMPTGRAFLAKVSTVLPALGQFVGPLLQKKGLKNQLTYPVSTK